MIWSNGFPFLDNKEEHVFNVPVSHAMTADPVSLPASDFPLREAEHLLNDNGFQGFPIVEDRSSKIMVGYIGRTELRYALGRARKEGILSPNALCVFTKEAAAATAARRASISTSAASQEHLAPNSFDAIQASIGTEHVDFSRYVDHTPLTVHPRLPLETVMEIFKKMGPRVILVEHRGRISGLVTVKDCLKYQFKVEAEENAQAATSHAAYAMTGGRNNTGTNANGGDTLEERVWNYMLWVRGKLPWWQQMPSQQNRPGGVGARARNRDGFESQDTTSGILDGTEDDGNVELEERDRR